MKRVQTESREREKDQSGQRGEKKGTEEEEKDDAELRRGRVNRGGEREPPTYNNRQ